MEFSAGLVNHFDNPHSHTGTPLLVSGSPLT
jgi:hypothetical protein